MSTQITGNGSANDPVSILVRISCPLCRHSAVLVDNPSIKDHIATNQVTKHQHAFGQRMCPNPDCRAHIFFEENLNTSQLVNCYPSPRIDFDASHIPVKILTSLEEAITCHSQNCFIASAIMVRKTLEDLCEDQGATGHNLKLRIDALGKQLNFSDAFISALDNLRLLGNDAAHVELKEFNEIGKVEVEIGIDCAKEILKATYQMTNLLGRLESLKKSSEPTEST